MSVNLMEGRIDGDENNSDDKSKIDLTLERPDKSPVKVSVPNKETINGKIGEQGKVKEIKVKTGQDALPKVPSDLDNSLNESEDGVSKLVIGIVMLLVIGTGVLLFMLNSESQFLKGSVNELPTTDSTQIVDDILAEDFNNQVSSSETATEVDTDSSSNNAADSSNDNSGQVNDPETESEDSLVVNNEDGSGSDSDQEIEIPVETESEEDMEADTNSSENLPETNNTNSNESDIISNYELQSSSETTDNLISQNNTNTENDFTPNTEQSDVTVAEEVKESDEIQGETGPGLWISAIVATLLSFAYARKNKLSQKY